MAYEINPKDGSQMVKIPAGPFIYGISDEQLLTLFETDEFVQSARANFAEFDAQTKELDTYYIDVFPITNAQFIKFMAETGYNKAPKFLDDSRFGAPQNPVVGVDWEDAAAYAEWAEKMLPSEEQWEKAARGQDGRIFPWGNKYVPQNCNCAEVGYSTTSSMGRFSQGNSPYEVEDMAGNVWEMTTGQWAGTSKTMRGGAFLSRLSYCRTTIRWTPAEEELKQGAQWLGFRCVKPG